MIDNELLQIFKNGLTEIGITMTEDKFDKFFNFKEMVLEWNNKVNLTSITDDREFIIKHFIDSLTIIPYLNKSDGTIIDVGAGAGFPGIPIKFVLPQMDITLLDSLDKKVKFLTSVIENFKLTKIRAIHYRAEDAGNNAVFREKFDYCVARAVAPLPVLLEYCLPFVKVGGSFLAMKGIGDEEIESSKRALKILGGELQEIINFQLPQTDNNRNIIIIKKIQQTPSKFPRKAGKPSKEPIK